MSIVAESQKKKTRLLKIGKFPREFVRSVLIAWTYEALSFFLFPVFLPLFSVVVVGILVIDVQMASQTVPYTISAWQTYPISITMSKTPGAYEFQWKMTREGIERFGNLTIKLVAVASKTEQKIDLSWNPSTDTYAVTTETTPL